MMCAAGARSRDGEGKGSIARAAGARSLKIKEKMKWRTSQARSTGNEGIWYAPQAYAQWEIKEQCNGARRRYALNTK